MDTQGRRDRELLLTRQTWESPNRYDQGSIFGPKPPIRSTLMRTISRFSPGRRNGYLSAFRNRLASLSM